MIITKSQMGVSIASPNVKPLCKILHCNLQFIQDKIPSSQKWMGEGVEKERENEEGKWGEL